MTSKNPKIHGSRHRSHLELTDGARIGVVGGGPAGSFFSFFLLQMADRVGLDVHVDLYEPRNFSGVGPASCNMCGGIISESLVQHLATEGINLPSKVVQRGIDSYLLHTDVGGVRIDTPLEEMRIGAVYRASGPRDLKDSKWGSFDGFLQQLAVDRGAHVIRERVEEISWYRNRPTVKTTAREKERYDLLVVAAGVNTITLKKIENLHLDYTPPLTVKTFIREYKLPPEEMDTYLSSSMHVFLLDIPGLEFAAIIPKGEYASICLLGEGIDKKGFDTFLESDEVRGCMPPGWEGQTKSCQCSPKMNVRSARRPFADRVVFIGDAGVTRLYKDGIGAAYRTAKAAATTAIFEGVSADQFFAHYWPTCRSIKKDNDIGRLTFRVSGLIQKYRFTRRAVVDMIAAEQRRPGAKRRMSMVMWDLFTGSATYREIFYRTLHPAFVARLFWHVLRALVATGGRGGGAPASANPIGGKSA